MTKKIRLTESQLHQIIKESVTKILKEVQINTANGEQYSAHGNDPVAWAHMAELRNQKGQDSWKNRVNARDTFNNKFGYYNTRYGTGTDPDEFHVSSLGMKGNDYTVNSGSGDQYGYNDPVEPSTRTDYDDTYNPYTNTNTHGYSKHPIYTNVTPENTETTTQTDYVKPWEEENGSRFGHRDALGTARRMAKANPSSNLHY